MHLHTNKHFLLWYNLKNKTAKQIKHWELLFFFFWEISDFKQWECFYPSRQTHWTQWFVRCAATSQGAWGKPGLGLMEELGCQLMGTGVQVPPTPSTCPAGSWLPLSSHFITAFDACQWCARWKKTWNSSVRVVDCLLGIQYSICLCTCLVRWVI